MIANRDLFNSIRLGLELAYALQKLYPGKIDFEACKLSHREPSNDRCHESRRRSERHRAACPRRLGRFSGTPQAIPVVLTIRYTDSKCARAGTPVSCARAYAYHCSCL